MDIDTLKKEIDDQHERNKKRWGEQPAATLILEIEDQVGKLRDAFLHRTPNQVQRRMVNVGSLLWAMAEKVWPEGVTTQPLKEHKEEC